MTTSSDIIYQRRVRVLDLAQELGNVSKACRQMGVSRTRCYQWRATLSEETIDEIEAWVHNGGRLLLQGYEYGDRHHGGNLNQLAARFGVRFRTDIIAPAETAVSSGRLAKLSHMTWLSTIRWPNSPILLPPTWTASP